MRKDENKFLGICNDKLFFEIPYPLEPIDSYHHPDSYFHHSGWLIAYPIEIFVRPSNTKLEKAIKKLEKETEKSGIKPFVTFWSGNYSFGIRFKTKKPTREEKQKIYDVFNHLRQMDWPSGVGIYK